MTNQHCEEICFTNNTSNLPKLRQFLGKVINLCKVSQKDQSKIILAVDEAVSNIIEHAYAEHETDSAEIKINVEGSPERFCIRITDSGNTFNPTQVSNPDIKMHIREGKKNGLGIFLMRQIMDEVEYNFKSGVENELVMIKYFRD